MDDIFSNLDPLALQKLVIMLVSLDAFNRLEVNGEK